MATIAVLGTMDTKGEEHGFVAELIRQRGHTPLIIDVGTLEALKLKPDVTREEIAHAAGANLAALIAKRDRGEAVTAMSKGAPVILSRLAAENKIAGVISLGGGGGTAIATSAMRALPIGFPKLMVSTLASGNTSQYVGVKDIVMFPSIVDVAGLNRISRQILTRAAGAICGMVEAQIPATADKPIIVASQFGNTTECVNQARKLLEQEGYEVLVFHATGTGGRTMESLIEAGLVTGVLDVTTTEWADELVGGILGAGPTRLEAAAKHGVPAIVTPGCLDMVNFGPPETVPAKFNGRRFYQHNPQVTLMRTTPEECKRLGEIMAEKLNASTAPVTVLIPLKGISVISAPGQPFHDPEADRALFETWKSKLRKDIEVRELDGNINDARFAGSMCAGAVGQRSQLRHKPNNITAMNGSKLRWGILSTAQIGRKNWKAIRNTGNSTVVAVASRGVERSRQFIAECQADAPMEAAPKALGSYEELLASKDVDAVYIPLPTGIRKEWVVRAAEAGKHIVCEKPCATSATELREMIDACRRHRVQFIDGVMFMHSRRLERIREVLNDGASVGQVKRITSAFSFCAAEEFFAGNIRAHSALEPYGCLGDLGWYCIRFALWVMNWQLPRRVTGRAAEARGKDRPAPVPTEFSGELLFDNGVSSGFYCSFLTHIEQWACVSGSKGYLRMSDFVAPFFGCQLDFEVNNAVHNVSACDFNMEAHWRRYAVPEYGNSHPSAQETNLFRNFTNQVRSGELNDAWPEMALKTQQVMNACFESAQQGNAMIEIN